MSKIITYCSFAVASLIVVTAFVTSTTFTQLAVAALLYPLLICLAFKFFPRRTKCPVLEKTVASTVQTLSHPIEAETPQIIEGEKEVVETTRSENIGINDIDKRVFLKLIGGVGLSLFLFSIFNRKAEALFFKSIPESASISIKDTSGNKIDPAQNQPTDGFSISEVDDYDSIITFYGFTNKNGAWFVMREDTETGSFRYARGDLSFPINWTNRKDLRYGYFSETF